MQTWTKELTKDIRQRHAAWDDKRHDVAYLHKKYPDRLNNIDIGSAFDKARLLRLCSSLPFLAKVSQQHPWRERRQQRRKASSNYGRLRRLSTFWRVKRNSRFVSASWRWVFGKLVFWKPRQLRAELIVGTKAQGLNETTGGGPDEVADKPREDSALGAEIYETTEGTKTLRGDTDNDKVCSL